MPAQLDACHDLAPPAGLIGEVGSCTSTTKC